jgi:hypothetical protein
VSYDDNKKAAGAQRIDIVQIEADVCSLSFGVAPCTATGTPCFNTWETCKDRNNYDRTTKQIRFCTPVSQLPAGLGLIPFLTGVKTDAQEVDPESSLGKRGSLTASFLDAPHDDVGIDPYVSQRPYNPLERGTFWPKFRARWPYLIGRALDWYQGYLVPGVPFDLNDMQRRTYIIDRMQGVGSRGSVSLVAKDVLSLADNKKAQYPFKSSGTLAAPMTVEANPTFIDVLTADDAEYDIESFEPVGVVRIKREVLQYTGTTPISGGVRLTGVTRTSPAPYFTLRDDYDEGTEVQKCAYFYNMKVPAVIRALLEEGAGVDPSYIDYAAWEALYDTWLAGFRVTRLICEPEGVREILDELIPQSNTWALWWDDLARQIRYEVVRPLDVGESAENLTDAGNFVQGSVELRDEPERIVNDLYIAYGQTDPTEKKDVITNYSRGINAISPESFGPNEVGQRRQLTVWGRWHPASNQVELSAIADKFIASRDFLPAKIEFSLHRKDDALTTAEFASLESMFITDKFGLPRSTLVRIIKTSPATSDLVRYMAREEKFSAGFFRWAPNDIPNGTDWADLTTEQKRIYGAWADTSGEYSDATEGKRWI